MLWDQHLDKFSNPHNNPRRQVLLASLHIREGFLERWNNSRVITDGVSGRADIDPALSPESTLFSMLSAHSVQHLHLSNVAMEAQGIK